MTPKRIAIVVCLHGDETLGLDAVTLLSPETLASVDVIIGNPAALALKRRFVQTDLNRCFPGSTHGTIEERRAASLALELAQYDAVIDVHTTTAPAPPFIIVTNEERSAGLIAAVPLPLVVVMPSDHGRGGCLIDSCRGVSLEFTEHDGGAAQIACVLEEAIRCLRAGVDAAIPQTMFRGIRSEVFETAMPNFEPVAGRTHEGKQLYAVLSGARSYNGKTILAVRD